MAKRFHTTSSGLWSNKCLSPSCSTFLCHKNPIDLSRRSRSLHCPSPTKNLVTNLVTNPNGNSSYSCVVRAQSTSMTIKEEWVWSSFSKNGFLLNRCSRTAKCSWSKTFKGRWMLKWSFGAKNPRWKRHKTTSSRPSILVGSLWYAQKWPSLLSKNQTKRKS